MTEIVHLIRDQIKQRDERSICKTTAGLRSIADMTKKPPVGIKPTEDRFMFSSWANQHFYHMNWGDVVGANIDRVRIIGVGGGTGSDTGNLGLCIILPALKGSGFAEDDCGFGIAINLEEDQTARLAQDETFMKFAEWK